MINKIKPSQSDVHSLNPQSSILNPFQDLKEIERLFPYSIQHRTIKVVLMAGCLLMPLASMGSSYFYCSKTSSYVYLGDSVAKVNQLCQAPTKIETIEPKSVTSEKRVDQWVYNFQPNSGFRGELGDADEVTFREKSLVINFDGLHISQLWVEGENVRQTKYCRPDRTLSVGDTQQIAIQYCAKPSLIRKAMESDVTQSAKQVIYTYQPDAYSSTKLVFENEKLVSIT